MKDYKRIPDQDLLSALAGKSRSEAHKAFAEIYSRYGQRVYAFIIRMTGDAIASQDILQEVFVKFHSAAAQKLVLTNTPAFLMTIARNLSLNWKRDSNRLVPLDELLALQSEAAGERDEFLHLINLAIEVLEPEYREAFVLKYYQGYDYEEMAVITGSTIAALRNKVWRAKQEVKRALRPYILEMEDYQ